MYYYKNFPPVMKSQIYKGLQVKRLGWLKSEFNNINSSTKTTFRTLMTTINDQMPSETTGKKTTVSVQANLFKIHSDDAEFDFEATIEMLSMLGMSKHEHLGFDQFQRCLTIRNILQHLVRYSTQADIDPYTVINAWVTGKNFSNKLNINHELDINQRTLSTPNSLISARHLFIFNELFVNNQLDLSDTSTVHFKQYVYFIHEILAIKYPELIFGVLFAYSKHHNTDLTQALFHVRNDFREYLRLFYKLDKGIQKRVKDPKAKLNPILDIDLLTYYLWTCSKEMALTKPIVGTVPGKLNPMS
jgi:hypothetical protein